MSATKREILAHIEDAMAANSNVEQSAAIVAARQRINLTEACVAELNRLYDNTESIRRHLAELHRLWRLETSE